MTARIFSATLLGIDAFRIMVEVQRVGSMSRFSIVGLPDSSVREARHRVRCAIESSGFAFPHADLIVSLSPAQLPKFGSQLDLAIALGVLAINGVIEPKALQGMCAIGELGLDGSLRPVHGTVATTEMCERESIQSLLLPDKNAPEAQLTTTRRLLSVRTLIEAVAALRGQIAPHVTEPVELPIRQTLPGNSFDDVSEQHIAKRALTIAAAGGHNVLLIGPPGSGKSMLASRLPSILPPLIPQEAIEVLKIRSAHEPTTIGMRGFAVPERPFRSPHHSSSLVSLIGGGSMPRPGEISLAHHGVLFLDELPEFRRDALEALRQPLEAGEVRVCRSRYTVCLPARFILVAAMNPCQCGFFGSKIPCTCSLAAVQRYRGRISGPILDRIDLHIWIDSIPFDKVCGSITPGCSEKMRLHVEAARLRQQERNLTGVTSNAALAINQVRTVCQTDRATQRLVDCSAKKMNLSTRSVIRTLKVARTIADIEGASVIREPHVLEALSYRAKLDVYQ